MESPTGSRRCRDSRRSTCLGTRGLPLFPLPLLLLLVRQRLRPLPSRRCKSSGSPSAASRRGRSWSASSSPKEKKKKKKAKGRRRRRRSTSSSLPSPRCASAATLYPCRAPRRDAPEPMSSRGFGETSRRSTGPGWGSGRGPTRRGPSRRRGGERELPAAAAKPPPPTAPRLFLFLLLRWASWPRWQRA